MISVKTHGEANPRDVPIRVIAMKYLFLKIPSKMFSSLSSLLQLTELKIWAKTKVLNTSVVTIKSLFSV